MTLPSNISEGFMRFHGTNPAHKWFFKESIYNAILVCVDFEKNWMNGTAAAGASLVDGLRGKAASFDGINDYITFGRYDG